MSYWDINQFLAEQQKVQFCLQHDAIGLQFLDVTKEGIVPKGQTMNTSIWLLDTLYDYLIIGQSSEDLLKVTIPEDYHTKSLDRINSFRDDRKNLEKVRIKGDLPYFYQIFDAMKKITQHEGVKFDNNKMAQFLEERGKVIIERGLGIFDEQKSDSITNNYTRLQTQLYKLARDKALQYEKWKSKTF